MPADIWMVLEGNRMSEEDFKNRLAQKMNDEYEVITGRVPDFRIMKSLAEVAFAEIADLL